MTSSLNLSKKYTLVGKKQKQSFGSSYQGRDTKTDQVVGILEIDRELIPVPEFQTQFELIADSIARLDTPYGAAFIEYGEHEGQIQAVYQFSESQSLSEILEDSKGLPVNLVLDLSHQIGEYFQALQEVELAHGWLNSDNVLLTSKGSIKVNGIGIAHGVGLPELLSAGKLSPMPYHAPEIIAGGRISVQSDFYALGVVLYQLLTGEMAADDKDSWPGRMLPGIPPELDELVAKCLNADPARRVQSAYEFLDYVEQARQGIEAGGEETIIGMEDSLVGQTLGSYRLVERLGQGGMATVYKAYEAALGRYVAVKVLPQFFARDPSFMRRFQREAKAVAQLSHPNIVPIHTYGEHGNITYIVMQYIEGGTLKRSRGNVLEPESALELLLPVVRALGYAHQRGIVHRDVKPSNILLTEGSWPMLADFGLAQMAEASVQLTGTGVGVGTPMYMSPEQGQGTDVDQRTDIYSMGIVLYELLTGDVPFRADTPMAVVIKHMTAPMPPPRQVNPDIPEELEGIILKATAKEPEDRFLNAEEMAQAMEAALRNLRRPVVEEKSKAETPQQPTEEPTKRRSRLPMVLGILASVVLVALGVFALTGGRGEAVIGALGLRASATPTATIVPPTGTPIPTSTLTATPEPPTPTIDHIATQRARAEATAAARDDRLVLQEKVSENAITSLDWSEDGVLAIASGNSEVYFLESLDQGKLSSIDMRRNIYSLDWQPGSDTLSMGTGNGFVLRYGYADQVDREELIAGSGIVVDVEWSGDGRFLAAAMDEGFVRSWNYSGDENADRPLPAVMSEFAEKISWSFDGSKAMVLRENVGLTVFENNADESEGHCQAADLSDDGDFVVCGFTSQSNQDDGTVDLAAELSVRRESKQDSIASGPGHTGLIYQLEFSPDGEYIASVGEDGTLRIWTGIYPLDRHHYLTSVVKLVPGIDIYTLAWSPDGSFLAAGDVNGDVWIWNVGEQADSTESTQDDSAFVEEEFTFPESIIAASAGQKPDYEDDFSDPTSGWKDESGEEGQIGYGESDYFILDNGTSSGNNCVWPGLFTQTQYGDFVMEFDARFVSGETGGFQVKFRSWSNELENSSGNYFAGLDTRRGVYFGNNKGIFKLSG